MVMSVYDNIFLKAVGQINDHRLLGATLSHAWRTTDPMPAIGSILRFQHRNGEFCNFQVVMLETGEYSLLPLDYRYVDVVSTPAADVSVPSRSDVALPSMRGVVRTVTVRFCHPSNVAVYGESAGKKCYNYFYDGEQLKPGTIVVVPVGGSKYPHIAVVDRDEDIPSISTSATKWIIQAVDLTEFERRQADAARRESLLKAMERRMASQSKMERFQKAASDDPEMKRLLDEYRTISA